MYTVLFPSGRTEVFTVKELAETYVVAFRGVLIGAPNGYPIDFNSVSSYNEVTE